MFSITAINDKDSLGQWEPLAPTKEAQEFHISQTYHDGLLKLQAKEYVKAQELLEAVLKDPLISVPQVQSSASDGHLLQLRFLALKNLATVFLEQGSSHYESALRCYLQAVEIDIKDSVIWNKLGTLACAMGSLSISRWAFEQGLVCSPNNWNCMEKLLEVLIAIGDEVACLSVAELILRHWPSHSRASHVKKTIEEAQPIPFEPRGIDKLEPKHVRLKFIDKRKATDDNLNEGHASKKGNHNLELHLKETTWAALSDALLGILLPVGECDSDTKSGKLLRSEDFALIIHLPSNSENATEPVQSEAVNDPPVGGNMAVDHCSSESGNQSKDIDANISDEQRKERRSIRRLERLSIHKSREEKLDFNTGKDRAKVVIQFLEPFILGEARLEDLDNAAMSVSLPVKTYAVDAEYQDVSTFIIKTSKHYGAYKMAHLLLEEAACKGPLQDDIFVKFLELDKLTRHVQDRSPECYLFLAELYHDFGLSSSVDSNLSDCMSEVSYHLCKIIELVALNYPFTLSDVFGNENSLTINNSHDTGKISSIKSNSRILPLDSLFSKDKASFWVRFFWLSGRLSIFEGNKAKANQELCISLSLLAKKENVNDSYSGVSLPHCKFTNDLTIDGIIHEINLLKVDFLMKTTVAEMIEREMYLECINLLAPLLFSEKYINLGVLPLDDNENGVTSIELSALDILIKACENANPMDINLYLNCHRRKLRILTTSAGIEEYLALCKTFHKKSWLRKLYVPQELKEIPSKLSSHLIAEEVKAITKCASQVKNFFDQCGDSNRSVNLTSIVSDIQFLLLAVMCNIASLFLHKNSSGAADMDSIEDENKWCFVDSATAFCKLQHLNPALTSKMQVELTVAIHDLLAEYDLCCASNGQEGEEGAFLKLAIKHLLALDMKLKFNAHSSNKELTSPKENHPSTNHANPAPFESNVNELKVDSTHAELDTSSAMEKDAIEDNSSKEILFHEDMENNTDVEHEIHDTNILDDKCNDRKKSTGPLIGGTPRLTDIEREELKEGLENALDQCFFCLYGLNLRSESGYEDELATHKNTSRGDYQTKEQCADVFQYVLSYAKDSSKTGLLKLRRVLRAIRKYFPQPPNGVLLGNVIDKFLDDPNLCEEKLSEEAGYDGFFEFIMKIIFPDAGSIKKYQTSLARSSEPYLEVYSNLYYLLSQSEENSATDKVPGFILTKEGEEFVQQNANLFRYDLLYNPLRLESWQQLANLYDEEVDLLLNDGSKHMNVVGWRKNETLPQRVDTSRRRCRRCLLMSLALAKTAFQQAEIHEMLALVYYDAVQHVVPIYDQRSTVPSKNALWKTFCQNSLNHFEKAFAHKQDWIYAFYMGKLSEKLGYAHDTSFAYYYKSITLNPSAVDPLYRMHASRLKLISTSGKQNQEVLKAVAAYSFNEVTKETVLNILKNMDSESSNFPIDLNESIMQNSPGEKEHEVSNRMGEVWHILYDDCLSALATCIQGDLKHFHKARYILAQGIYRRGENDDLEKAKEELSFCFKSSRSSFTINMWEIDGMVKKGRRKTPSVSGNKKILEVNLPESSRKFITCIRKYILFYLQLLEETGDISTLDRAYISLRADKRFSLCLEDLIPVAVGRYIKALILSIHQTEETGTSVISSSSQNQLEKIFTVFTEQVILWTDICSLPEIKSPGWSESILYRYLYQYIQSLAINNKLETLEAVNEKIRRRFKNPKLSNSNCAKVCRHASIAWCRSLIISLALITPLHSGQQLREIQEVNSSDGVLDSTHLLFADIQTNELWNSAFEDQIHLKSLDTKWSPVLSEIKNVGVKKASEGNLETANALLKCSYNFYRDSSCTMLPSGLNLYLIPSSQLATQTQEVNSSMQGIEILDLSIPRKLLLWAYTLLHGRYTSISAVVKHCEENAKPKMKKGCGTSSLPTTTPTLALAGGEKDHARSGEAPETGPLIVVVALASVQGPNALPRLRDSHKSSITAPQFPHCDSSGAEKSKEDAHETGPSDKV